MDSERRSRLQPVPPRVDHHWVNVYLNSMSPQSNTSPNTRHNYEYGRRVFMEHYGNPGSSSEPLVFHPRTPPPFDPNCKLEGSDSSSKAVETPRTPPEKTVSDLNEVEEAPAKICVTDHDGDGYDGGNDDALNRATAEEMATFALKRAASVSSAKTANSTKSIESAKFVALGGFGFGTLRLHKADMPLDVDPSQTCLLNGDVVLVAEVPNGATIGYDLISHTIQEGRPFQGLREFPPGVHFVWGASNSPTAIKNGFWFVSQERAAGVAGDCHVLTWNRFTDEMDEQVVKAVGMFQRGEVADVFDSCYAYNIKDVSFGPGEAIGVSARDAGNEAQLWLDLTFAINGSMLTRLTGQGGKQWKVTATCNSIPITDVGMMAVSHADIPDPRKLERTAVNGFEPALKFAFARQDAHTANREIKHQRHGEVVDFSRYVEALVAMKCGPYQNAEDLVGELQFSYISGMFLDNINCQEHFVFICRVVLRAYDWAMEEPSVYASFLRAFTAALDHDDKNTEGSIFDHNSGFRHELRIMLLLFQHFLIDGLLIKRNEVTEDHMELSKTFEKLESWLLRKWDWDLRDNADIRVTKRQLVDVEFAEDEDVEFAEDEDETEIERGKSPYVVVNLDEVDRRESSRKSEVETAFGVY